MSVLVANRQNLVCYMCKYMCIHVHIHICEVKVFLLRELEVI